MMTEAERERIARDAREEATDKARLESRVAALEAKIVLILRGFGMAAAAIGLSIWDKLSGGLFK